MLSFFGIQRTKDNYLDWKEAGEQFIFASPILGQKKRTKNMRTPDDFYDYLKKRGEDNYLIFNFSSKKVNSSLFDNRIINFSLEYISLDTIFRICYGIDYWNNNPSNYIVFHDDLNSYKSELVLSCYQIREAMNRGDVEPANSTLDQNLSIRYPDIDIENIPLQMIQFINYFQTCFTSNNEEDIKQSYILSKVCINYLLNDEDLDNPHIDLYKGDSLIYTTREDEDESAIWENISGTLEIPMHKEICGDLTLVCYDWLNDNEKRLLFTYWIHTAFLSKDNSDSDIVGLYSGVHEQFLHSVFYSKIHILEPSLSEDLIIQLALKKSDHSDINSKDVSFFLKGVSAREQGLLDVNSRHYIVHNKNKYQQVYSTMYRKEVMDLAVKLTTVEKAKMLLKDEVLDPAKEFANRIKVTPLPASPERRLNETEDFTIRRSHRNDRRALTDSVPSLSSINIADIGETIANTLPTDIPDINDISLDDFEVKDLSSLCNICKEDKPNEKDQLITCSICSKKYHTTCVHLPQIPYSTNTTIEKRKHEAYIKEKYKNWKCAICNDIQTAPVNSPKSQPGSPRRRGRNASVLSAAIPLYPEPLLPEETSEKIPASIEESMPGSFFETPSMSNVRPANGTDLSQGGVIVGTKDYDTFQKALIYTKSQLAKNAGTNTKTEDTQSVASEEGEAVPIYTDSEASEDEDTKFSYISKSGKQKTIKIDKLSAYLKSILSLDDSDSGQQYVEDVVNRVMSTKDIGNQNAMFTVPMFLLQAMIQSAAFRPKEAPFSKVSVIGGQEFVRIAEHPQLSNYFDRFHKGEDMESIKKDMIEEGIDAALLSRDPNDVVLLDDYTITYVRSDSIPVSAAAMQHAYQSQKVPRCQHPAYSKYFMMLKRNIQEEKVILCMQKDGVDPSILKNPDELIELNKRPVKKVKLCDHPAYSKYFKMLRENVPEASVRLAMMRDKVDISILERNPDEEIELEEAVPVSIPFSQVPVSSVPAPIVAPIPAPISIPALAHTPMPTTVATEPSDQPAVSMVSRMKKVKLCEHPDYFKYFNMLKKGLPRVAVEHAMMRDKVDKSILDRDPNEEVEAEVQEEVAESVVPEGSVEQPIMSRSAGKKKVKLCEHPDYFKYFNMLKKGLPRVAVEHAMMRDKVDKSILDRDSNEEIEVEGQEEVSEPVVDGPSPGGVKKVKLCEHPEYFKYFNMLKKGLPRVAVEHAMMRDKVDKSILDRDPNEEVVIEGENEAPVISAPSNRIKLCEHPDYSKYFNMLKKGLPRVAVEHAMMRDKVDKSILDRDPNEEIEMEGQTPASSTPSGDVKKVKLCEHPDYSKYFNMLKKGLPRVAVEHAMMRDKVDKSVLDRDPDEEVEIKEETPAAATSSVKKVKLCEHPDYSKYFNMLKKGLPRVAVEHAMMRDKVDKAILDRDPNEEIEIKEEAPVPATPSVKKVKLCEHPDYSKYFNMLKKGLPRVAVEHAMMRDKVDKSILDRDPNEEIEVQEAPATSSVKKVKLCEHPDYSKYFNMLKKGLPRVAVEHAMMRDKVDKSILDRDPNEEIEIKEEAPGAAPSVKKVKLIDHPSYRKYYALLREGTPEMKVRRIMKKDGVDPSIMDKDPSELVEFVEEKEEKKTSTVIVKKVKLCDHPDYSKYFNMLKKGLPRVAVEHAMMRDKVDKSIIDKDPNEEIEVQEEAPATTSSVKKVKLCEHPDYSKYFNMLKKGLPRVAVEHAMMRDKVDKSIIDRDPDEEVEVKEEAPATPAPSVKKVKLCEHPDYSKYFNMLKKGLPRVAVEHAMMRDKVDKSILDRDPNEEIEIKEEVPAVAPSVKKVKLCEHPDYSKYFNMLKKGLPRVAVEHAMMRDKVDKSVLDRDPDEEVEIKEETPAATSSVKKVKLCEHPDYSKYFNMLKKGLPRVAVEHAMMRDKVDKSIIDRDPDEEVEIQEKKEETKPVEAVEEEDEEEVDEPILRDVKLCQHPEYELYFKLLAVGLPKPQVLRMIQKANKDVSILDEDPEKIVTIKDKSAPLWKHPIYAKYFAMLKGGLPMKDVESKARMAGDDVTVLKNDPKTLWTTEVVVAPKKKRSVKKKCHWHDLKLTGENLQKSYWNNMDVMTVIFEDDQLITSFEEIFVNNPEDQKVVEKPVEKDTKPKLVTFLDGKRSTNIGIAMSKVKCDYESLRKALLLVKPELANITIELVENLRVALPNDEDLKLARGYSGPVEMLAPSERFVVEMMKVPRPLNKLNCLFLKMSLTKHVEIIRHRFSLIVQACGELKESLKLKKLLESVLMIGNLLNNQNETPNRVVMVKSFTLDSLQNLASTKGFDKKTSLLMFLEKVLSEKLPEVFDVMDELTHLIPASRESFDGIRQDEDGLREQVVTASNELKESQNTLNRGSLKPEERADLEQSVSELEDFVSSAQSTLATLRTEIEEAKNQFLGTLEFFGQDQTMKSEDFFEYFTSFFNNLFVIHRKMEEMRERLNNKQKKEKEKEMLKQKQKTTPEQKSIVKTVSKQPSQGTTETETGVGVKSDMEKSASTPQAVSTPSTPAANENEHEHKASVAPTENLSIPSVSIASSPELQGLFNKLSSQNS